MAVKAAKAAAAGKAGKAARRFPGFPRDAMQFWHELAAEMSREWFAENKQRYEEQWVAPMEALFDEVVRGLGAAYRPLRLGEPRVLRIYRDVRFSRDKTPYKTHIAAVVRVAGKPVAQAGNAALYFEVGLDDEYAGVGCYQFGDRAARWRKAVVGAPGDALLPIIARLRSAGYEVRGYDDYKRVPRGFAADHPRAELLKQRGLICSFPEVPAGLLHKPAFAAWMLKHARATAPIVIWLHRHVG